MECKIYIFSHRKNIHKRKRETQQYSVPLVPGEAPSLANSIPVMRVQVDPGVPLSQVFCVSGVREGTPETQGLGQAISSLSEVLLRIPPGRLLVSS